MAKKTLSKLIGSRWAIRQEDAELMASSDLEFTKNEDGYRTARKEDGTLNLVNTISMVGDVAVIRVDGPLSYRDNESAYWWGEDTYSSVEAAFDKCLADSSVKGIIFDINSPGGEVNGCADLANKIFESRGSKPYGIVSRTGGMMCSAAYWLGSSCEKVYTAENGTLGSIGVLCSFTKYNEKLLKVQTVVSDLSPNKAPDPENAEGLALIKKELNDLASVFISAVAKNRGQDYKTVLEDFGQGGVFIGAKAVSAGLADGVKSIEEICDEMKSLNNNQSGVNTMATKTAEPKATEQAPDMEALKASIIAEERNRVSAINALFEGLEISAEEKADFVNGNKTVAEAKDFAFDKMKAMLGAKDSQIAALKAEAEKAKAETNAEMVAANKKLLDEQNKDAAEIQGGAISADVEAAHDKAIAAAFALGCK